MDTRLPASQQWRHLLEFTGFLLGGLMVGVPLFAILIKTIGIPIPFPILVGVGLVGGGYTIMVARRREWVRGGIVALIILATFNADIPLTSAAYEYPTAIAGRALLVHLPLAYLSGLALLKGWPSSSDDRQIFSAKRSQLPVILLCGFVGATVLSALFGIPKNNIAWWFVFYAGEFVIVTWLVMTAIRQGYITPEQFVTILFLAILGHVLVGLGQFINQDPFGLTYLGEGGSQNRVWIQAPVVGMFTIGPYISGFTGMSFTLGVLCLGVFPIALSYALRKRGNLRVALVAGLLLMALSIRLSASDAIRGAFFAMLLLFSLLVGYLIYRVRVVPRPSMRATAVFLVLLVTIIAAPSTASDTSFSLDVNQPPPPTETNESTNSTTSTSAPSTTGTTTPGSKTTTTEAVPPESTSQGGSSESAGSATPVEVSIPLFSTSNFGTRFTQYMVALDVFASHPVVGIGGLRFVHMADYYGLPTPPGLSHPRLIHNTYLALLVETGLLGFSMYVLAVLLVLYVGGRSLRPNQTSTESAKGTDTLLMAGVLAGLCGILIYALWHPQLYNIKTAFVFWMLAGVVLGMVQSDS